MVMMHHDFVVEYDDDKQEHITSTLIDYGVPNGYTSMARTVGIPAAIGARMVLDGTARSPHAYVRALTLRTSHHRHDQDTRCDGADGQGDLRSDSG